jgi:phospholipid/cholesterol/gamma-HCH transport system ATP-binding protein
VRDMLHTLPPKAQQAIRDDLEGTHDYRQGGSGDGSGDRGYHDEDTETATTPASHRR